jgi:hypothetical protein
MQKVYQTIILSETQKDYTVMEATMLSSAEYLHRASTLVSSLIALIMNSQEPNVD